MTSQLIKWLGPNYRVRITGLGTLIMGSLTGLAALPYTLGDVAVWVPPDLKPWLVKICGGAALILKIINVFQVKSSNVSGNAAQGYRVAKGNDEMAVVKSSSPDLTVTHTIVKMDQPDPPKPIEPPPTV